MIWTAATRQMELNIEGKAETANLGKECLVLMSCNILINTCQLTKSGELKKKKKLGVKAPCTSYNKASWSRCWPSTEYQFLWYYSWDALLNPWIYSRVCASGSLHACSKLHNSLLARECWKHRFRLQIQSLPEFITKPKEFSLQASNWTSWNFHFLLSSQWCCTRWRHHLLPHNDLLCKRVQPHTNGSTNKCNQCLVFHVDKLCNISWNWIPRESWWWNQKFMHSTELLTLNTWRLLKMKLEIYALDKTLEWSLRHWVSESCLLLNVVVGSNRPNSAEVRKECKASSWAPCCNSIEKQVGLGGKVGGGEFSSLSASLQEL